MPSSKSSDTIPVHEFNRNDQEDRLFELFPLLKKTGVSTTSPHIHDYFELFLFENGGGSHFIDFQEVKIEPNSIHLVAPGQVHHLKRSNDSIGFAIMFMESFLRENIENSNFVSKFSYMEMEDYKPVFQFSKEEHSDIIKLISLIQKEIEGSELMNIEVIRHYINILILWCRNKKSKQVNVELGAEKQLYAEFRKQINLNYKSVKKVKEYAQLLNTNERYLNEISQKGSGKSASTLIFDRIIIEAKRLIVNTELSVKEICFELNYDDQAHFSKFFKKKSNHTPSQFRELYK